jgi:hypothetical protein
MSLSGWRRGGVPAALRVLALVFALSAVTGGCLDEAADRRYDYDNPEDTTPAAGDDDTLGTVAIVFVDDLNDVVVIVNGRATDENLENWTLEPQPLGDPFTLPAADVQSGGFIRVHSEDGEDTSTDLYGAGIDWSVADEAILKDDAGEPVSSCEKAAGCWP